MLAYRTSKVAVLDLNQQPMIQALQQVVAKMPHRDQTFAENLISNYYRWGSLSDKQLDWVKTLTDRVLQPLNGDNDSTPAANTVVVDVTKIQELFDTAALKLRSPRVKLATDDGMYVVFARAGHRSKYAGQVLITDGKPFGQNQYYGRIDTTGKFYATKSATDSLKKLVRDFADSPADVAKKFGKFTGQCSFCTHTLQDERSLDVGYGPVCAKNFNLAWG